MGFQQSHQSLNLPEVKSALSKDTFGVTFNQEEFADDYDNVISIPARTEQAKKQGTIVIALKGTYLKNFANNLTKGVVIESVKDVKSACISESTSQRDLTEFGFGESLYCVGM